VGAVLEQGETGSLIRLEGTVDIASAADLKALMVEALAAGREVAVSLEAASYLDVTAVQLLWAADREARSQGLQFALRGPCPAALRLSLAQAGLADLPLLSERA
jgi:anti-anti-sigma factor